MNQKPAYLPAWIALACLFLAGCGSLRDAFLDRATPLAPPRGAALGQTSRDEILHQFGEPEEIDARRFGSLSAEVAYYLDEYFDDHGQAQYRFLACEFGKGALTGYSYHDSATPADEGFDEAARAKLVKGQSTRREAESALGPPNARALLPTTINLSALELPAGGAPFPLAGIPEGAAEAWQYHSQHYDEAGRKTSQQTLTLLFDAKGVYLGDALLHELVTRSP
jgi:hypothetical protein